MLADVVTIIATYWDDIMRQLGLEDREAMTADARAFLRSDDNTSRHAAAQRLVEHAASILPARHPVRRALAAEGYKLGIAPQAWELAERGLLEHVSPVELAPGILGGSVGAGTGPQAQSAPATAPGTKEIRQEAETRLLTAPAVAEEEVRRRGVDPQDPGLIRLWPPGGVVRLPTFQFDPSGHPYPVVMTINRMLDAAGDPWGVADWWLGQNAWMDAVPAESIGQVSDGELIAAARAVFEEA